MTHLPKNHVPLKGRCGEIHSGIQTPRFGSSGKSHLDEERPECVKDRRIKQQPERKT
jgi:hypothetical protein